MKQWYAVYTKPSWERRVATALKKKNLLHYLPIIRTTSSAVEGAKKSESPLFPSCVFVKLLATQHKEISQINGVLSFLYWIDEPAIFADAEIEMIAQFLESHNNTVCLQIIPVRAEAARVLESQAGDERTAQLILPSFGFALSALIPDLKVRLAARTERSLAYFSNGI